MRYDINSYISAIVKDNEQYIAESDCSSVAEYIINDAESNGLWHEFFDRDKELDGGDPTEEQIAEFKDYLYDNWDDPINPQHYYTINGVKVFLAYESDMQGVEPYEVNRAMGINAYRLEDYHEGVDIRETYYEDYTGSYDDGLEICIANVVNAENDQHVIFNQWICVDELDDVNEELANKGFEFDINDK